MEKVIVQAAVRFSKPIPLKSLLRDTTGPRVHSLHGRLEPWPRFLSWQAKVLPDNAAQMIAHARSLGLFESGVLPEDPPYHRRREAET